MVISGWVISLNEEPQLQKVALGQLSRYPWLTLGQMHGSRVSAAVESQSSQEFFQYIEVHKDSEGVSHVDMVCVHYEDHDFNDEEEIA